MAFSWIIYLSSAWWKYGGNVVSIILSLSTNLYRSVSPPPVPRTMKPSRPNLTPLKMPEKRGLSPSTQAETSSSGSTTPATATPGSAGSAGAMSPQWTFPGSGQPSSPSPLTVTFTEQHVRQHAQLASENPVRDPPMPALAATRMVQYGGCRNSNEKNDSCNSMEDKTRLFNRPAEPLETDAEGRIKAYISFDEFNEKIAAAGGPDVVFADFVR